MAVDVLGCAVEGVLELLELALLRGCAASLGRCHCVGAVDGHVIPFDTNQALIHVIFEDGGFCLVGVAGAEGTLEVGVFADDDRSVNGADGEGVCGVAAVDVEDVILRFQRATGAEDHCIVGAVVVGFDGFLGAVAFARCD